MGHQHCKDNASKTVQYWRCVNRGCPGRVYTMLSDGRVTYFREHTHGQNTQQREKALFKAGICAKVAENPKVSLRKVYMCIGHIMFLHQQFFVNRKPRLSSGPVIPFNSYIFTFPYIFLYFAKWEQ